MTPRVFLCPVAPLCPCPMITSYCREGPWDNVVWMLSILHRPEPAAGPRWHSRLHTDLVSLSLTQRCGCPRLFMPLDKCTLLLLHYTQTVQRRTVRHSSPGPLNTAQPEFFCCKTKLTMLFYIYVFVYTCNLFSCMYVWVWDLWFYPWYAWSMA